MDNSKLRKTLLSPWFALIAIALAAFVIYSNTCDVPFVFDDIPNIKENPFIRLTTLDLQGLSDAGFKSPSSTRPVANISFALNYYFGGYDVTGYHLVNIIIHIICGILVYFLALFTFQRDREIAANSSSLYLMSLFAALLFTVHPLQTQSVTYIVQRMNSMAAMFYLLSMLLYIKGRLTEVPWRRWALFSACLVSWTLALGSKEIAVTLPLIIFLYEWYFFQDLSTAWLKRNLVYFLGICIVAGFAAFIYLGGSPLDRILAGYATRDFTMYERVLTEFRVVIFYITLLILPLPSRLNLLHDIPVSHSLLDPVTTLLSLLVIAGLIGYAVYRARKWRLVSFCVLWFFVNLVIESSIIGLEIIFEHRLYLPLFGFALLVSYALFHFMSDRWLFVIIIAFVIILALAVSTYHRNRTWHGQIALWSDAVFKSPNNARAHNNLGFALGEQGNTTKAIEHYYEALRINPDLVKANYNLGVTLGKRGDTGGATRYYMKTLRIDPDHGEAHYNLGKILEDDGDLKGAAWHYSEVLRKNPEDTTAHNNLGVVLSRLDDLKGAVEHFSEAVRINPKNARVRYNLGRTFSIQGRMDEAAEQYLESLRIRPQNHKAQYNLAIVLHSLGDFQGAIDHFEEAARLDPRLKAQVSYNIARAYARQGKTEESGKWLRKAVEAGFNNWNSLKTDADLDNIRDTLYYKKIMEKIGE